MPNGKEYLNDMDFDNLLTEMGDDQLRLLRFVALRQYEMTKHLAEVTKLCPVHDKQIHALQNRSRKAIGATGGIGAFLGAAIATAIDYLLRR